jgi:hypothetical protein
MKILWQSLKLDVLLGASAAVLLIINTFKAQFYIAGVFNMGYMWGALVASWWYIALASFCCTLAIAIRLLVRWQRLDIRERVIRSIIITGLICGIVAECYTGPFGVWYLKGLRAGILTEARWQGSECKSFEYEVYGVEWGLDVSPHPTEPPEAYYEGYYTLRVNDRAYVWLRETK